MSCLVFLIWRKSPIAFVEGEKNSYSIRNHRINIIKQLQPYVACFYTYVTVATPRKPQHWNKEKKTIKVKVGRVLDKRFDGNVFTDYVTNENLFWALSKCTLFNFHGIKIAAIPFSIGIAIRFELALLHFLELHLSRFALH